MRSRYVSNLLFSLLVVNLIFLQSTFTGCDFQYSTNGESEIPCDDDTSRIVAYKPNIYIYPNEEIRLIVKVDFPLGGKVIESIPQYKDSWDITVDQNGKINDTYDYLFYECEMPNLTQKVYGWIIEKSELEEFFISNMTQSGFNQKETNDFIEYWIPMLTESKYYEIYPQYKSTLDKMVVIKYSVEPKSFYRLFYVIKGRDDDQLELLNPSIEKAKREKYFAVEWGVIL